MRAEKYIFTPPALGSPALCCGPGGAGALSACCVLCLVDTSIQQSPINAVEYSVMKGHPTF